MNKQHSKCPDGYYRSKTTGHCRKDKLKPCSEGYVRDEKTRRCKKIKRSATKKVRALKACQAGYSRSGKNNRCQKDCPLGTTRSGKNNKCLKDCPPGRVRNSAGRCVYENDRSSDGSDSFIAEDDEPLEGDGKRMMAEEVAELKKGRLGKDLRPNITCIDMFDDDALMKELEKRKKMRGPVNMLVARKKIRG